MRDGSLGKRPSLGQLARAVVALLLLAACFHVSLAGVAEAEVVRFEEPFSPLTGVEPGVSIATPAGLAVDDATGNVFLVEGTDANRVDILGGEGDPPAGLASPLTIGGLRINNEASGAAYDKNPSSPGYGTLYVADTVNRKLKKFERNPITEHYETAGELTATPAFGEVIDVDVDAEGNVFVSDYQANAVIEFDPDGAEIGRVSTAAALPGHPGQLAVDAAGDLFVQGWAAPWPLKKWVADEAGEIDPSQTPVDVPGAGGATRTGLAVNRPENALFVVFPNRIVQYDASTLVREGEFGGGTLVGARGIAVNESNGRVYVSDNGTGRKNVTVYGPGRRTAVADISPATDIGASRATVRGSVNAEGSALSVCRFEYGPSDEYGQTAPCAETVPGDSNPHPVGAELTGLDPNATYHFRLVAINASQLESTSADATFTTFGKPQISEQVPDWVEGSSARISARVDPAGFATNYRFEWGLTAAYGHTVPADFEPAIPAGTDPVKVVANLSGLAGASSYHFRLAATNAAGTTFGPDQRFETLNGCGMILGRCLELASPPDKGLAGGAGDVLGTGFEFPFEAATSGSSLVYSIAFGLPDATAGGEVLYRGARGNGGWTADQLTPEVVDATTTQGAISAPIRTYGFSRDMSCFAFASGMELTSDTPRATVEAGWTNLYLREVGGSTRVVTNLPFVAGDGGLTHHQLTGISEDCERVVFTSKLQFPGLAGAGEIRLYEWDGSTETLRAVSAVPGPAGMQTVATQPGAWNGNNDANKFRSVSADGSHVLFSAERKLGDGPAGSAELNKIGVFARIDGQTTLDLAKSQTAIPDAGARYQIASRAGDRVLFTANYGLTEPPAAEWPVGCSNLGSGSASESGAGCDLYEYDFSRPEGERLVDLSLVGGIDNLGGAGVAGVAAASDDLTKVYFVARGRLVRGAGPSEAQNLADGTYSVYLRSPSGIQFVGVIDAVDLNLLVVNDNKAGGPAWRARTTPSGRHFVFEASGNVTGDEPSGVRQVYRFDATTGETQCLSCLRSGGAPVPNGPYALPVGPEFSRAVRPPTIVTEDGDSVFFMKSDRLAAGAVEGQPNLYEWHDGQVTFLGTSFEGALRGLQYVGSNDNGSDVYFATMDRLTWQDQDSQMDIYDARRGGGFAQPSPTPPSCDPDVEGSCQAPAPAQGPSPAAGSAAFSGPGNVTPKASPHRKCPRGKRLVKAGKRKRCAKVRNCRRKHGKKRSSCKKKSGKHQRNRRAGNGRRAGK